MPINLHFFYNSYCNVKKLRYYFNFLILDSKEKGMKSFNKAFTIVLLILAFAFSLNAATLQEIKKSGVIKIATEGVYPPYSFHNKKDELVGYDVEIAREVAKRIGVKVEFVEAPWDALIAGFDAGKADVMFNQVSIIEERKKKYDFSMPYTSVYGAVIVRKDNNTIKDTSDLKGKVAVNAATSNWAKLTESFGAKVIVANGFSQEVDILLAKRAEFVLNDDVTFYEFIKNKPKVPLKIAFKLKEPVLSAAIVKKGNKDLLNAINDALDELSKSGELSRISIKYFGQDISK